MIQSRIRKPSFITLLFFVIAAGCIVVFSLMLSARFSLGVHDTKKVVELPNHTVQRMLDGKRVDPEFAALRPYAVMVENHIDARPVSGIERASIVYEIVSEGEITRYMALFDPSVEVDQIGPVRSARPYFVDIAEEWNPIYFHAGGSPEALAQLKTNDLYNINEISGDGIYFYRDPSNFAPHNLFTSSDLIVRAITLKELPQDADFTPWKFADPAPVDRSERVTSTPEAIGVPISIDPDYAVSFEYQPLTNRYVRYVAGSLDKTKNGIIVKADNVVVQYVDGEIIDELGRRHLDLEGSGEAEIYTDGKRIRGTWQKFNGRTRFYDSLNEEIIFQPGVVWVSVVTEL